MAQVSAASWRGARIPILTTDALLSAGGYYDAAATADNFTVTNKADLYASWIQTTDPTTGPYAGKKVSVPTNLKESIARSRYAISSFDTTVYDASEAAYPGAVSRTKPNRAKAGAYTYMKAPRWNGKACEVGPFARLAVAGLYPVDQRNLRDVVPGYTAYVKTVGPDTGLDPAMISADIAVALVADGLAKLKFSGGTVRHRCRRRP